LRALVDLGIRAAAHSADSSRALYRDRANPTSLPVTEAVAAQSVFPADLRRFEGRSGRIIDAVADFPTRSA
jgi:hypothetical protein